VSGGSGADWAGAPEPAGAATERFAARPPLPLPPPPKGGLISRIGDIPIRIVYLAGAILATVLAVLLVFLIFSDDVPNAGDAVTPAPAGSVVGGASPRLTELPAVPARKAFATLPGEPSAVSGTVTDQDTGIGYPRLGKPWEARSFAPFAYAQRVGKVAVPNTVIASAMLPGEAPAAEPATDADYRALAVRAARWTLRTQYPADATLTWTASQKAATGEGWTLGFEVTYTQTGQERTGQAMVSVLDVGETKPAMLMASIPAGGKAYWRDLNTLATKVRPL